MKTASFKTYTGPGRVSIARFAPRNTPAGYRQFKALAPGSWFNSVDKPTYEAKFAAEILGPLNPQKTLDELLKLTSGAEPVLLCWEVPPFDDQKNWCHRRLVATWFERHLGIEVPELGYETASPGSFQTDATPTAGFVDPKLSAAKTGSGALARAARIQRAGR